VNCHALLFFCFAYPAPPVMEKVPVVYMDQFRVSGQWVAIMEQVRLWERHVEYLEKVRRQAPRAASYGTAVNQAKSYLRYWNAVEKAVSWEPDNFNPVHQAALMEIRLLIGEERYDAGWSPPRLPSRLYPVKKMRVMDCANGRYVVEED
jgi:hypothetical protein